MGVVAWRREDGNLDPTEAQWLPGNQDALGLVLDVRAESGPEVIVDVGNDRRIACTGIDWAHRLPGDSTDPANMVEMRMRYQHRDAAQPQFLQRSQYAFRFFTGVDHEAVGRIVRVNDVTVRPVRPERKRGCQKGNRVSPSYVVGGAPVRLQQSTGAVRRNRRKGQRIT